MNKTDLDKLKTKQDFGRPVVLTSEQQSRLGAAILKERTAFKDEKILANKGIASLSEIKPSKHLYLAKTVENPFLSKEMSLVLKEIEKRFKEKCQKGFIIIISMTRTVDEEMKINPKISKDSPHLKGEAVDFAGKFMQQHFPESADALKSILMEMQKEGKVYFTNEESTTSFWHVARRA